MNSTGKRVIAKSMLRRHAWDISIKRASTMLVGAMLSVAAAQALAEAGRVEFVHGSASILDQAGQSREVSKGSEIAVGDTLQTAGDGRLQVKFVDGGYISLQPNSSFKVEEYHYTGAVDGSERGIFRLIKGGLRAITGVIGHANKPAYRMDTPVATIGIRGTEFTALLDDAQKLIVKVGDGAVFMENGQGSLVLYKGQSGEVAGSASRPGYSLVMPVLAAAGPQQASMEDTLEEKQTSAMADQGYVNGDMRDASGMPCAIAGCSNLPANPNSGGGSEGNGGGNTGGGITPDPGAPGPTGITAEILAANQAGVTGSWSGSGNVAGSGLLGSFVWLNATSNLSVNFARYEATLGLSLSGLGGVINRTTTSDVRGELDPQTGRLVFSNGTMTGTWCELSCTLIINSASLSGTGLSRAGISFSVSDLLNLIAVNNQTLNLDRQ